jgi:hypothetical protein
VNEEILEIILTGEFRDDTLELIKNEVVAIEKSVNIKSELIDIRKMKGNPSITEIYSFARSFASDRIMKTAIVDVAENCEVNSFLETTSFNVGLSFKFFTDIDTAKEWLKSK